MAPLPLRQSLRQLRRRLGDARAGGGRLEGCRPRPEPGRWEPRPGCGQVDDLRRLTRAGELLLPGAPGALEAAAAYGFIAVLIVVTFIDIDHRIIPDVISLPGIAAFFLAARLVPSVTCRMLTSLRM